MGIGVETVKLMPPRQHFFSLNTNMGPLSHSGVGKEKMQPGIVALAFSAIAQRSSGMGGFYEPTGFRIVVGTRRARGSQSS